MNAVVLGDRISVVHAHGDHVVWGVVTSEPNPRVIEWRDLAHTRGTPVHTEDEGITWVRGILGHDTTAVRALLAAYALRTQP